MGQDKAHSAANVETLARDATWPHAVYDALKVFELTG
jgi:hypothetical protein